MLARLLPIFCASCALLLPACAQDGHFHVFDYTTAPNYDTNIHTVHVPIFENRTLRRGLEFDLTRAVVREIHATTPFRVVGANEPADTELKGVIVSGTKAVLNISQVGEIREAETAINVELTWTDLRTGEILSRPARRPGDARPFEPFAAPAVASNVPGGVSPIIISPSTAPISPVIAAAEAPPLAPGLCTKPPPLAIRTVAGFIPELGESITTAYKRNIDKMAVQIVSAMEKPW